MGLDDFYRQLRQIQPGQPDLNIRIEELLNVDLQISSQAMSSLQRDLANTDDYALETSLESLNLFDNDWPSFANIVGSYLKLCRDIEPQSLLKSHDLYLSYINEISIGFLNNTYGIHLTDLLHNTLKYILPLMINMDRILNIHIKGKKYKRLIFLSTVLSKLFNHLRALKGYSIKKNLILFIVNKLNKIYFIINSPLLCANIFANMNLIIDLKLSKFPLAQQVEYRYILGRYYLIKNQLVQSFKHLDWSYQHCRISETNNKLRILRYLIPVGLLLEKFPNYQILNQYSELSYYYQPLIKHLKHGNHFGFQSFLCQNQEYFKSKKLLILLSTKSKVLIFKNLIKNSVLFDQSLLRFQYKDLRSILMLSIKPLEFQRNFFQNQVLYEILTDFDDSFIENICTSIIENDLMKGNVLSRAKSIVLSKRDPFPDTYQTYERKFGTNSNEKWMDL